jgi:hypothetical protein
VVAAWVGGLKTCRSTVHALGRGQKDTTRKAMGGGWVAGGT